MENYEFEFWKLFSQLSVALLSASLVALSLVFTVIDRVSEVFQIITWGGVSIIFYVMSLALSVWGVFLSKKGEKPVSPYKFLTGSLFGAGIFSTLMTVLLTLSSATNAVENTLLILIVVGVITIGIICAEWKDRKNSE